MKNDVYIFDNKLTKYDNDNFFNPSTVYKEGLNISIKSDRNIYNSVRELFYLMGMDKENYGKQCWNPFKCFIKNGSKVVIKPNLVNHVNQLFSDTSALITNFAIIRPIIDYCIIALKGSGSIIVGDAPVQECDFDKVIELNGLKEGIEIYNRNGYNVELVDFRKNNNEDLKCKVVSLGTDSSLSEVDMYCKKYAITNYNLKYMHQHHGNGIHEYLIPNIVLEADVIINLPKPKTHRKAGITACMKNFVGVNGKKEYLPHHRNGSVHNNGDEFPEKSIIKSCQSFVKNYSFKNSPIINFSNRVLSHFQRRFKKNRFLEGSWYGNDTIWRTILDINKIVLYANKKGIITNKKQRVIFNLADMIVSGEKEGPLLPTNKEVGLIVAGFNQLNVDKTICHIMGFDDQKIKYIYNGYKLNKYKISQDDKFIIYDNTGKIRIDKYNKHFIPTDGWIDYLCEDKSK